MKLKTDFVTNSSSTAFIVFWPKKVNSIDEVAKYIERKDFQKIIFEDIERQDGHLVFPKSSEAISSISESIRSGWDPEFDIFAYERRFCSENGITTKDLRNNRQWINQMYRQQDKLRDQNSLKKAADLVTQHEGCYVYFFEYGDEGGGIHAELEHENDWGGLPYIPISHH